MSVSCPRCGLAFETQATTNTRCRRCRYVVRVGSSPARARRTDPTLVESSGADGGGVLLVAAAGLALWFVVRPIVRAVRRHGTAPTFGPVGPEAGQAPSPAT